MDLKDSLKQIAERIDKLKDNIPTEDATKNAFILPFIASLGYDVFNPLEVLPEMNCDIAGKKEWEIVFFILYHLAMFSLASVEYHSLTVPEHSCKTLYWEYEGKNI